MTTITWRGGTSHFWENAANWSGSVIPQAGDDVVLPGVLVEVFGGVAANIRQGGASTLWIRGSLGVSGTLSGGTIVLSDASYGGGELDLSAGSVVSGLTLRLGGPTGTVTALAGTVTLAASVLIPEISGELVFAGPGVVDDDGTIALAPFGGLIVSGTLGGDPMITLSDNASAEIDAVAAGASPTIDFTGHEQDVVLAGSGTGVTLQGLQGGDRIDLPSLYSAGSTTPVAEIVDGTLEVTAASGDTASIALADPAAGLSFLVIPDETNVGSLVEVLPYIALTATTDFDRQPGVDYGTFTLDAATAAVAGSITMEGFYTVDLRGGATWTMDSMQISSPSETGYAGVLTLQGASGGGTVNVAGALALSEGGDFMTTGALSLTGGVDMTVGSLSTSFSPIAIDATSAMVVGSGTATAGALTVAAGATMNATSVEIHANVIDNGTIYLSTFFAYGLEPTPFGVGGNFTLSSTLIISYREEFAADGTFSLLNTATLDVSDTRAFSNALAVADNASATISLDGGGEWDTSTLTIGANVVPSSPISRGGLIVEAPSADVGFGNVDKLVVSGAILLGQDAGSGSGPGAGALTLDAVTATASSLSLLNGSSLSLDAASSFVLGTGIATLGALTIGSGATLSADFGTIAGDVIDDGVLTFTSLDIAGDFRVGSTLSAGSSSGGTIIVEQDATIGAIAGVVTLDADAAVGQHWDIGGAHLTGLTVLDLDTAVIDLPDVAYSSAFGGNVATLDIAGAVFSVASLPDASGQPLLSASDDGSGGTFVTAELACYAAGTRILAEHGEMPVEALRPGDVVRTLSGRLAPVVWVGRSRVDLARHPQPWRAAPIRIAAGAIGPGLPRRDLFVSPDHALLLDGALVPVWQLANGATIARCDGAAVTYCHVELDRHDILLAEGLPAESYLDTGNRGAFANEGARTLHPDFAAAADESALRIWAERSAAPLLLGGERVAALRAGLRERVEAQGWRLDDDPGLAVTAGGVRLALRDGCAVVPAGVRGMRLRSRTFVPVEAMLGDDRRKLGVAVSTVLIGGWPLPPEAFAGGWHKREAGVAWRWTDGDATLTFPPLPRATRLELRFGARGRYWHAPAIDAVARVA